MRQVWLRGSALVRRLAPRLGVDVLTALSVLLVTMPGTVIGGAVLAAAVLAFIWWRGRGRSADPHPLAKAVLIAGVGVAAVWLRGGDPWLGLGAVALLGVALLEPGYRRYCKVLVRARQLPGFSQPAGDLRPGPFFAFTCALGMLLVAAVLFGVPGWSVAIVVLAVLAWRALVAAGELRAFGRRRTVAMAAAAVQRYQPDYCIYFSGKPEGLYQISMWLPFLERTGRRLMVIVREDDTLAGAAALTSAPIVMVRSLEALESFMTAGLGAVFYVNNEPKNVNGVRFLGATHVHLGHGDSDKPSSYHPSFAMFDRIFVAGQAAIDRFAAHGVHVEIDKFVIVGRPQAEAIEVAHSGRGPVGVVLYAPTWRGGLADMTLGSLSVGHRVVDALIDRGLQVWFRPHPYSYRDSESRVQIARIDEAITRAGNGGRTSAETSVLSIVDCFNASDALVSDVSSVASDYLFSRKPLAIVDMGASTRPIEDEYPVARAGYVLDARGDIEAGLDALVGPDPLAAQRAAVRVHYLGDLPDEGYSDVFVRAAADAIDNALGRARR